MTKFMPRFLLKCARSQANERLTVGSVPSRVRPESACEVSYKGTGPLTNDLVGGHVAVGFNTIPPAIGNIEAGRLRAIAVAAPTRSAALADVPTAAEPRPPRFSALQHDALSRPARP